MSFDHSKLSFEECTVDFIALFWGWKGVGYPADWILHSTGELHSQYNELLFCYLFT